MLRISICFLTMLACSTPISAQVLPSSFTTQYVQFSMGNRTGSSETNKPEKVCNEFSILNGNSILGRNCSTDLIILTVKFINLEQPKYESNGSWSKRSFGYDPNLPSYAPDGTQNLTHVVTIGYDSQANSYSIMIEKPNAYKDVSFVWYYFNL